MMGLEKAKMSERVPSFEKRALEHVDPWLPARPPCMPLAPKSLERPSGLHPQTACTIAETHLQAKGRKQCGRHLSVTQNSLAHWSLDVLNFKSNNMAK